MVQLAMCLSPCLPCIQRHKLLHYGWKIYIFNTNLSKFELRKPSPSEDIRLVLIKFLRKLSTNDLVKIKLLFSK